MFVMLAVLTLAPIPSPGTEQPVVYDLEIALPGNAFQGELTIDRDVEPAKVSLQAGGHAAPVLEVTRSQDSVTFVTGHGTSLFVYTVGFRGDELGGRVSYNGGALEGTVHGRRRK